MRGTVVSICRTAQTSAGAVRPVGQVVPDGQNSGVTHEFTSADLREPLTFGEHLKGQRVEFDSEQWFGAHAARNVRASK